MVCIIHWVSKSWTQLSEVHFHFSLSVDIYLCKFALIGVPVQNIRNYCVTLWKEMREGNSLLTLIGMSVTSCINML